MRFPWSRSEPSPDATEKRDSGGDFSDAVVRLIEAQAAGSAADASSTAAIEAAAGGLSRAFAGASVEGPEWAQAAVSPSFLAQVGRDLVRSGDSLHVIQVSLSGEVRLVPCSSWHWEGSHDQATWTVRATAYGPSTSTTWNLPNAGVIFVRWGGTPGLPYVGVAPTSWAHTTARLQSETERSLADEAKGPLAQLIGIPADGGAGDATDPLAMLKADIRAARGKALLLETTSAGWGEGMASSPRKDWVASRLGPNPPDAMATLRKDTFEAMLAACGTPPSLYTDADGTSQREALRRWHLGTVLPLAGMLQRELMDKLETDVRLRFDNYPLDLDGRAKSFKNLVAGGMDVAQAVAVTGLLAED